MANFESAFTARFRMVNNTKRDSDRAPDQKLVVDFTVEQAQAAAEWLMQSAMAAQANGSTVRVYAGKDSYDEIPGFSLWGGFWSDKGTGSFSPAKVEPSNDMPF